MVAADGASRRGALIDSLIARARPGAGRGPTIETLYDRHHRELAAYLYRLTGDVDLVEDLLAEVFLAAIRGLPRFRDRGHGARPWLYRIALNVVRRHERRRAVQDRAVRGRSDIAPDDASIDAAHVRAALRRLAPAHRDVLTLHHVQGLTIEETAASLRRRPSAIKSQLARAREALRRELRAGGALS